MSRFALLGPAIAGSMLLGGAAPPGALTGVAPGLWEVSRSATGSGARRLCLTDVAQLAAYAHAGERCTRTVLTDRPGYLVVDVACPGGDFARSTLRVTTPRSLKLQSQGIHRGEPFDLTLYARRIGRCPPVSGRR